MKKLICILLMAWLPVFMVTAGAMSLQMTLQGQQTQQADSASCHDNIGNQKSEKIHQCIACGFCMMATSMASFDTALGLAITALTSTAPLSTDVVFKSINDTPAFRPPIFS